jgi:hypothetical protein
MTDAEKGGHGAHRAAPGTAENVFSGQSVHGVNSMSGLLNLPGAHSVHCLPVHMRSARDNKNTRRCVRANMLY